MTLTSFAEERSGFCTFCRSLDGCHRHALDAPLLDLRGEARRPRKPTAPGRRRHLAFSTVSFSLKATNTTILRQSNTALAHVVSFAELTLRHAAALLATGPLASFPTPCLVNETNVFPLIAHCNAATNLPVHTITAAPANLTTTLSSLLPPTTPTDRIYSGDVTLTEGRRITSQEHRL